MLLLPEEVDDYVGADNPMRFVDAFVDELNLAAAGFKRVTRKVTREVTLPRPRKRRRFGGSKDKQSDCL
jgi:hypothetical protein